jgi:hypothetical protein
MKFGFLDATTNSCMKRLQLYLPDEAEDAIKGRLRFLKQVLLVSFAVKGFTRNSYHQQHMAANYGAGAGLPACCLRLPDSKRRRLGQDRHNLPALPR